MLPGPGGGSAGADDGAVDAPQVVVDAACVVQFVEQGGDDAAPGAVSTPGVEAVEDGLPGAVLTGDDNAQPAAIRIPSPKTADGD
jgi:hypothetical protein